MYANIITKQQLFIVKICKYSMPLFLDLCSIQPIGFLSFWPKLIPKPIPKLIPKPISKPILKPYERFKKVDH